MVISISNLIDYLVNDVKRYPEKTAISDTNKKYTYRELYSSAKKFAYLISTHNLQNCPIGVIANHNVETIAMFLGVLYSGNFYVPIDPDMPTPKMQMIISDSDFEIILGLDKNQDIISQVNFSKAFYTESATDCVNDSSFQPAQITGETPAYMVYTSGSTGVPKGVVKSHSAVISFVEAFTDTFDFTQDEVIGNQTPFFFDASAKDIYLMLKLGCTMEILPSTLFSLPPELIDYINEKKVTYACWVPTALSIVAQLNPFSLVVPQTLKKVFFVGEVMQIKHLKTWVNTLPHIKYVNLYGSSETAGVCCYYEVKPSDLERLALPIGKVFSNCRINLIDDNGKIIDKPNQIGEMFVVTEALAIEYFNDREKTEKAFQHRDFGCGMERCFKTGDLAYYDEDNNLIFASRTDFQIKHMGHRIELGEIEAVCTKLDIISHCCCLYDLNKKKIVLICKTAPNVSVSAQEIKSILKNHLSSYMVPGKVVVVDELPLNANGKIDRQKLRALYT